MLAVVLQALGAVCVVAGLALASPAAGLVAAGAFLILFGVASRLPASRGGER